MSKIDSSLVILTANGLLQRSNDTTFAFRQDSNFWYATGINEPDLTLVIDGDKEYIVLPPRDEIRNVFDGKIDVDKLKAISGVDLYFDEVRGWKEIKKAIDKTSTVAILQPLATFVERHDFYSNPARKRLQDRIQDVNSRARLLDIRPVFAELRVIKQPQELEQIQKAIDITCRSIEDVYAQIKNFTYEYQVEAALTQGFRSRGAKGHAFEPIVSSGKNATILHYLANDQPLQKNSFLLMDVGAEVENYASDVARTIPVGKVSSRHQAVLSACLEAQQEIIKLLKPGSNYYDLELKAEKIVGAKLKRLGLIKTNNRKSVRKYFPHAISHFVGLDTHDVGERNQGLAENMVITIEPSIIIEEENIGVRFEDDILITNDSYRVLSSSLPSLTE